MCLENIYFETKFDKKENDFVGIGFKQFSTALLDYVGRFHRSKVGNGFKVNKWLEATGNYDLEQNVNNHIRIQPNKTLDYFPDYFPGFHIFTTPKSAFEYYNERNNPVVVAQVLYKNVVAFGTNLVQYNRYEHTVIAKYMKIVKYKIIKSRCESLSEFS